MVCVSAYNPRTFPWNSIERRFQMRIWAAVFSYVQVKSSQLSKTFQTILQIREEILQKILIELTSATFLLTIYIIPIFPYCNLSWLICKLMGCNRKLFEVKQICLDCKVSVMILRKKTCWQHIHSFRIHGPVAWNPGLRSKPFANSYPLEDKQKTRLYRTCLRAVEQRHQPFGSFFFSNWV